MRCTCGSYAINHNCHGRDGSDGDKCDVCYWRSRAERYAELMTKMTAKAMGLAFLALAMSEARTIGEARKIFESGKK